MDTTRMKNICSSLERELGIGKIFLEKDDELNILIQEVKKLIKDHRKKKNTLSDKTYETIFGSISHWNQPLAERAWTAWSIHSEEMKPLLDKYDVMITEDDIASFVKARNNITHNGINSIEDNIGITAFLLMGLVYCCALSRIGLDSALIKEIMSRYIIE